MNLSHNANPLIRQTSSGSVQGIDHTSHDAWLGIPYAQTTAGPNRWKAPKPFIAKAHRKADQFGQPCLQPEMIFEQHRLIGNRHIGSEDCLSLNIWAPKNRTANVSPIPVIVWIHGGANVVGNGNIEGGKLASSQQVIVVSINYRLGILGWFSHPALRRTAESIEEASGNFGTLDIIESLRWVQLNIRQFGGDPNNVTLMGLSAGGWNVFSLLHSPIAQGLFHKAIIHSGEPRTMAVSQAENRTDDQESGHPQSSAELLLQLLIDDGSALDRESAQQWLDGSDDKTVANYLRGKRYPELEQALDRLARQYAKTSANDTANSHFQFRPIFRRGNPDIPQLQYQAPMLFTDGVVLSTQDFYQSIEQGCMHLVPVILGTTRDESKNFQILDPEFVAVSDGKRCIIDPDRYELTNQAISQWWKAVCADEPADALSDLTDVYVFRFDWDALPKDEDGENLQALYGASHGIDQSFIFGDTKTLFSTSELTGDDQKLSAAIMSYWSAFAYTGSPGKGREESLPEWTARSRDGSNRENTLVLNSPKGGGIYMNNTHCTRKSVISGVENNLNKKPEDKKRLYNELKKAPIVEYGGFPNSNATTFLNSRKSKNHAPIS